MTTPNLDALAKLAPFTVAESSDGRWVHGSGVETSLEQLVAIANDWAELRTEKALMELFSSTNAKLVSENAELRAWRSEHDCRYTQGAVADIDGIHCPIDDPCVRCQRRMEREAVQKENADLRAYRERTEDSMRRISEYWARKEALAGVHSLRCFCLWREPGEGATDGN